MFDLQQVNRSEKNLVKYKTETVKTAKYLTDQIKSDVEKIINQIGQGGTLCVSQEFNKVNRDKFYFLARKLESKVNTFLRSWPNIPNKDLVNDELYIQLKTILEIYNQNIAIKNDQNSLIAKFLNRIKPDKAIILEPLNKFLSDTTKYLEYKLPSEIKKYFTVTVSTLDKLDKRLIEFEQKGNDLSYSDHQLITKYNIALKALFEGIDQNQSGFHSFNLLNIPRILNSLNKIQIQSNAVLDLRKTLNDYMASHTKTQKIKIDNVINTDRFLNSRANQAKSA